MISNFILMFSRNFKLHEFHFLMTLIRIKRHPRVIIFEAALGFIIVYQIGKNLLSRCIRFQLKSLNGVDNLLALIEEYLSHVQKVTGAYIVRSILDGMSSIMGNRSSFEVSRTC